MPDAYARFDGQELGYGFGYTLSLGTQPGIAQISAPTDAGRTGNVGTLDVFWQGRRFFRLFDARLVNPSSPSGTTSAPALQWQIEDRRWKWQYGQTLDGDYNVPQEDGTLLREKNPRELADLCWEAMGEKGVDVSAFPREPRPRKFWRASDPADELNRLCQEFGCAPAWSPFTNKAYTVKLGQGTAPANLAHKSRTNATTSRPRPDAIRLIGGDTLFQTALDLGEPVGLEVDGTYVPINDLTYKPAGGWESLFVGGFRFSSLNTTYTDAATGATLYHRDLAAQSIWRCFRIKGQQAGGFSPELLKGKANAPKSIKDIGPFTGTLLEKDPLTGERLPAYARGEYYDDDRYGIHANTKPSARWKGSVSINNELRIVTFDKPVFKVASDGTPEVADLELIAAYEVSHEGVPGRYEKVRQSQGRTYNAGEYREHREEIVREIIEKTASATGAKVDNLKEIDKQAKYYIDAIADQYVDRPAASVVYSGLERFSLDGVLRSIAWAFSVSSAPQTTVGWDTETTKYAQPWEDRAAQRNKRIAEAAIRRDNATRARLNVINARIKALI